MPNSVFLGGGGSVTVSSTGALTGNGTVATPLAVNPDGVTITVNGSNELVGAAQQPSVGTLLTADPGSPSNDTWWVDRIGTSPTQTVALKAQIGGSTYVIASVTR